MENFINILKHIKFNIITKAEGNGRFDIARIQENEIISYFNSLSAFNTNYIAFTLTQFLLIRGQYYNTYLDSCYGDIVITDKKLNEICFIDLKTPMTNNFYGAIKMLSLKNMSIKYNGSIKRNRYFLCLHNNGSFRFINAYDCYLKFINLVNYKINDCYKYIIKSKFREESKEQENINIELPNFGMIYNKDFLSESFFNLYPELNLVR